MESTVVDISILPPSFKPVSLSLSRISFILKHPNKSFFNPINIFSNILTSFTITLYYNYSGPLHGWLFDFLRTLRQRTSILFGPLSAGVLGLVFSFHYKLIGSWWPASNPYSTIGFWIGTVCFGIMAGGGEAVISAGTAYVYPKTASRAFAAKLLSECFGQVCGYLVIPVFGDWYEGQLFLLASLLFLGVVVVGWVVCSSNDLIEEDMERVVKENERVKENEENKNCDERRMENGVHESKVGSVVELQIPMVR